MLYGNKFVSGTAGFDKSHVQADFKFFGDHASSIAYRSGQTIRYKSYSMTKSTLRINIKLNIAARCAYTSGAGSITHCKGCCRACAIRRTISTRVAAISRGYTPQTPRPS